LGGGGDESGFCTTDSEPSKLEFQNSNVIDVPLTLKNKHFKKLRE